jgi:hypothetical protein
MPQLVQSHYRPNSFGQRVPAQLLLQLAPQMLQGIQELHRMVFVGWC